MKIIKKKCRLCEKKVIKISPLQIYGRLGKKHGGLKFYGSDDGVYYNKNGTEGARGGVWFCNSCWEILTKDIKENPDVS